MVRIALAIVAAAVLLGAVDLGFRHPAALSWEIGGLVMLGLPIGVGAAASGWMRGRLDGRRGEVVALGVLVSGLTAPVVLGRGGDGLDLPPVAWALFVGLPVVGGLFVHGLVRRLHASWGEVAVATLLLVVPTAAMSWAEGLLVHVRLGSDALHLQLYAAAAFGCLGPAVPVALALGGGVEGHPLVRRGLGGLGLLFAVGLVILDRTQQVGLYPHVHTWLQWQAIVAMVAGLSLCTESLAGRVHRVWAWSAGGLIVTAGVGFFSPTESMQDIVFRAAVAEGRIGRTLLRLRPRIETSPADVVAPLPALDRMHEVDPPTRELDLVLITVDTLRGDALERMPRVMALAEESLVFERAYAPAPATFFSLPAILAGRQVGELDWKPWRVDRHFFMLADRPEQGGLAARLRAAGLTTIGIVDGGSSEFLRPATGYADGFDRYEAMPGDASWPTSQALVRRALREVDEAGPGRWFVWLHFYDPHRYESERADYERLVRVTDAAIGELLDGLRARGHWAKTALVLTADHGEAFGEHGQRGHGSSLYEEQIRVPLIVRVPGAAPRREARAASAIDVAPTLAKLGGASLDGMTGVNLTALAFDGRYPDERPIFSEFIGYVVHTQAYVNDQKVVIVGPDKLIWDRRAEALELFDLAEDPGETRSLLWERTEVARQLQGLLRGFADPAQAAHPLP